jgi:hypothetical protein
MDYERSYTIVLTKHYIQRFALLGYRLVDTVILDWVSNTWDLYVYILATLLDLDIGIQLFSLIPEVSG